MSDLFPRRYAICGVSARAIGMFLKPMVSEFTEYAEPVALLDIDPLRFKIAKEDVPQIAGVPEYKAEEFDKMVAETKPDVILALGMDCTHVTYILQGLAHDLDVVSEKPMATTSEDCRRIVAAEKRSKGKVICSFNYRYPTTIRASPIGNILHHQSAYSSQQAKVVPFMSGILDTPMLAVSLHTICTFLHIPYPGKGQVEPLFLY